MLKTKINSYNGLASRNDLLDKTFMNLVRELRALTVDGFENMGWDEHWARVWEFPAVTAAILDNSKAGDKVLESGSGITQVPFWLTDAGLDVTGIDLDANLGARWDKVKIRSGKATFKPGDMLKIPFDNNVFDSAFSISAIEHTGNAPVAVEEMVRVVKPGGVIAFTMDIEISSTDSVPLSDFHKVQDFLLKATTPVYPAKFVSPAELLTFTNRTLAPQSRSWLGLKHFAGSLGMYKWRDQCIFFYCGCKK